MLTFDCLSSFTLHCAVRLCLVMYAEEKPTKTKFCWSLKPVTCERTDRQTDIQTRSSQITSHPYRGRCKCQRGASRDTF